MLMNQKPYQLQFCKGFDQSSSWTFSGFMWILPFSPIFLSCACPSCVLLRGLDHLAGCQAYLCITIYLHPGGAWVQHRTGRRYSMATGLSLHRRLYFALAACLPVLLPFPSSRAVGLNTLDRPSSVSPMLLARSLLGWGHLTAICRCPLLSFWGLPATLTIPSSLPHLSSVLFCVLALRSR